MKAHECPTAIVGLALFMRKSAQFNK